MLNLDQVQAFLAVVEAASFRKASERLNAAQPTVSQQVRKLEAELGRVLLERGRHACRPTRAGAAFLPHARALVRAAERARNVLYADPLLIGASGNVGTYLLPPVVRAFADDPAAPEVDMVLQPNPETALKLENGEIDVAVMEWWDGRPGFQPTLWRREPMRVILPPDHPWAAAAEIPAHWLFEAPLIGGEPGSGTGRLLTELFGDDAGKLDVRFHMNATEGVKMAVRHGLGVSIALASSVADETGSGHLVARPIAGADLTKDIYCIVAADLPTTSPARRFREVLLSHGTARDHPPRAAPAGDAAGEPDPQG